jgi:hypothetical protein
VGDTEGKIWKGGERQREDRGREGRYGREDRGKIEGR